MLIVEAQNFTYDAGLRVLETAKGLSDYKVNVYINQRKIWAGNVINFQRKNGAAKLVSLIGKTMEEKKCLSK